MRAPEFWDRKTDGWWPTLLRPLGCLTAGLTALRIKRGRPRDVGVPVICIGNLVAGGAGKTPVALDLLTRLKARGVAAHVVSRGYGGREMGPLSVDIKTHTAADVGDEALLLAKSAPTWISRDRAEGAEAAITAGAAAIVLDDGYQNPALKKDLSLLVVDGGYGFGNGRVIPAGPLREPVTAGLARADAVVVMGADDADIWGRVKRAGFPDLPILRARLVPTEGGEDLKGREVYAFAGIGRPQKFFDTLTALGARLAGGKAFDDHHLYTHAEVEAILADAGSAVVVTTAKDWVRLAPEHQDRIRAVAVDLAWKDDAEIDALLKRVLDGDGNGPGDGHG